MISIEPTSILPFMKVFLMGEEFDQWDFVEGSIQTHSNLYLDGHFQEAFFEEDVKEHFPTPRQFVPWSLLKNVCKEFIKGKHTPLAFKFILRLNDVESQSFFERYNFNLPAKLYLNIRFEKGKLFLTSGTALETFSLDKSIEQTWDQYLNHYLYELGIS